VRIKWWGQTTCSVAEIVEGWVEEPRKGEGEQREEARSGFRDIITG